MISFVILTVIMSAIADTCINSISAGSMSVVIDGKSQQLPVVQTGGTKGPKVTVNGNSTTMSHNARVYLAENCDSKFKPTTFFKFMLMDKTISYTADLSGVECGCNAALYLVSMPAYSQSSPDPTRCGDYYCDANQVCGVYCPEIDLFEANNRNIHITPHTCNNPIGHFYPGCDGGGYVQSAYQTNPSSFGPGPNYIINTQMPFQLSHTFESKNGYLNKMISVFSQAGKNFTLIHDKESYLKELTGAVKNGMVVAISLWGDGGGEMSWLDVPPCSSSVSCNTAGKAIFSNVMVH